ncbi:MAG TPA: nucleoside hydrolase [Chloroflexota bacterium]|nr:nucleoside hydrolase [Chloroflexota bacterium]
MSPIRLIMDVDTGVDDALAMALAVRHPDVTLEAVLTVAGNVELDLTTRNTLRVLDWLGATDVPVAAGADRPLSGVVVDAGHWHGVDGLGGAQLPDARRQAQPDGVGYLIDRVRAEPGELTLVCVGPLTNLALALGRWPELAGSVREVILMGGAARLPGNVTPVAEFNIYADPAAAASVFQQPWRVTMVGLDVTNRALLTRAERDALARHPSPEAQLVYEVTRHLFDVRGVPAVALHDPLAVAVAIQPELVTTIERAVQVETRGDYTLGQTVVDFRAHAPAAPPTQTRVALEVDVARFRALFDRTLGLVYA